ncbi:2'-5' RNA ligase family protein [Actinomycetospora sp. TBRC 11914]|uniref:2'-5' RNA ligase family protein n=1 Tax=Actinomycetospora sp. TBRC 11914 TaxID=2729387 RepID=UPI00145FCAFF|nr:2'-5' RNA ligase family protein [Actinomycetospora sp. TBRC 11914]NMO91080.1 2'-5' RNA ligase family protein [Actinomycetospora sp. TBRC 11914]
MSDPLIVSAVLAAGAQDDLDARRRRWFPAERLQVGAHLTLFHALPGDRAPEVAAALRELTGERPAPAITVGEAFGLGRGVAVRTPSPALKEIRATIADRFRDDLTAQDARPWRPHLTLQNKVGPDEARRTLASVRADHTPYDTVVEALALWRYRHGPWEAAGEFRFGPGAGRTTRSCT